MAFLDKHKAIETNATLLLVLRFLVVTIGGLVQIVPLFYLREHDRKRGRGCAPTRRWNWPGATSTSARAAMSASGQQHYLNLHYSQICLQEKYVVGR